MAHIRRCQVCKGQTLNVDMHPECEIAFLSDLLFRIKVQLTLREVFLPRKLTDEILRGTFRPLKDFKKSRDDEAGKAIRKQMWELAKHAFMQKALQDFEKENPDPDPIRY